MAAGPGGTQISVYNIYISNSKYTIEWIWFICIYFTCACYFISIIYIYVYICVGIYINVYICINMYMCVSNSSF